MFKLTFVAYAGGIWSSSTYSLNKSLHHILHDSSISIPANSCLKVSIRQHVFVCDHKTTQSFHTSQQTISSSEQVNARAPFSINLQSFITSSFSLNVLITSFLSRSTKYAKFEILPEHKNVLPS